MKLFVKMVLLIAFSSIIACANEKKAEFSFTEKSNGAKKGKTSERVDLVSRGVGPITKLELSEDINQLMEKRGKELFEVKCTICHKQSEKFIGPPLKGILKRRTPEWVMNMILNPESMLKEDKLAQDLFMEFNGQPMSNQGLTEGEARMVLEYLRGL